MNELNTKRAFSHDGWMYLITSSWESDTPLTYGFEVERHRGQPQDSEPVAAVSYDFPDSKLSHAFTESDVLLHKLLNFVQDRIRKNEEVPEELPDDWMTQAPEPRS